MNTEYRGTTAEAIQDHYDRGNAFYSLWLDETMTYSAAIWDGADSLEDAQLQKLDFHAEQAGAPGAARVLDIGCGWGSMLRRLVLRHGVGRAVGLTLSEGQQAHVEAMGLPGVEVHLENWADHRPDAPYDAAISIGALEHFARVDHDRDQKIAAYRDFFVAARDLLRPGARLSLQTIVFGLLDELDPFIKDRIWPESNLPRLDEVVAAADKLFEIELLRNDRLDYARTCRTWANNMIARRADVEALTDEATYGDYVRYLKMSARAFEYGAMGLVRMRLSRVL